MNPPSYFDSDSVFIETNNTEHCWAVVPAAGIGSRMNVSIPKQYLQLNERSLIEHSLQPLLDCDWIRGVVVAISEDDPFWNKLACSSHPKIQTVIGGAERVDSVRQAVNYIDSQFPDATSILVHDAARPCLSNRDLELLYQQLSGSDTAVILADKISDTVKQEVKQVAHEEDRQDNGLAVIDKTIPRDRLWRALTPQLFAKSLLVKALNNNYEKANSSILVNITDEASAVEALGVKPLLIQGRSDNIKVTKEDDLALASLILTALNLSKQE